MGHAVGIIPARWGSTRFPGKVLADIHGKPMLWHVHRKARAAQSIREIIVATDDDRIAHACEQLGIYFVKTRIDHPTGTDRSAEAAEKHNAQHYVTVQGDEPMVSSDAIDMVVDALHSDQASNACSYIRDMEDLVDTNVVKVVTDVRGRALAFSRSPIPYPKNGVEEGSYRRVLGLYGFTRSTLQEFSRLKPGPLENAEGIEMYRMVENGIPVKMVNAREGGPSVDTPHDLEVVRRLMR